MSKMNNEMGGYHLIPTTPNGRTSRIYERLIPHQGGGYAKSYSIFLSGSIGYEQDYIAEINLLRNIVQEGDEVTIFINSGGGNVYTGWQITNAMADCVVPVRTVLDGSCMSMAAIIFLCGDQVAINRGGLFMLHDVSHSNYGKQGGEVKPYIEGLERQIVEHYANVLKSFLSEEEYQLMMNGTDLYFTPGEVNDRIIARNQLADEIAEKLAAEEAKPKKPRKPRTTSKSSSTRKNANRKTKSSRK
jgi:ATP-dependent protease ClpP protease subunit